MEQYSKVVLHNYFFLQHRYYGKSMPHGFTGDESLENATIRGYFNSADYAEVIIDLKKNLSADSSPVIVVGGSYGGSKSYEY